MLIEAVTLGGQDRLISRVFKQTDLAGLVVETQANQTPLSGDPTGFRLAAEATLRAIEQFTAGALRFDLLGVKQMRAFDANVVIVSVVCTSGDEASRERRLLGCHLAGDDSLRGAVIATLQATNRLLGNAIATRY